MNDPLIKEVFGDSRYQHLADLADLTDPEAEDLGYDRLMTLNALAAIYSVRSAEKQGKALARATWALVAATIGLVITTVALVLVTTQL